MEKGQAPSGLTAMDGNPGRQSHAAFVRMAEVAEVHRRGGDGELRGELHLRSLVAASLGRSTRFHHMIAPVTNIAAGASPKIAQIALVV